MTRATILLSAVLLLPVGWCGEERVAFPLPNPSDIGAEAFSVLLNRFLLQQGYAGWKQDLKPRSTGPYFLHDSGVIESKGIHGPSAVKVYYSPQVWEWMQSDRKGVIADGEMIVKVLFARRPDNPAEFSSEPTGFSIMVKDSRGSWDGWFYSDGGPLQKPTHEHAASFFDPNAGFALSCMNCHASADNRESTFSSVRNVFRDPIQHLTSVSAEGLKKGPLNPADIHNSSVHTRNNLRSRAEPVPSPHWDPPTSGVPQCLPLSVLDHVPQGPRPDGHRAFITSSNCTACHDAVQLYSALPNMALHEQKDGASELINLSPSSEWRHSLMGLSGRDPVFFAQLETERALHPELADEIDNKCLSCHAVMGQRQWQLDHGKDALFTHRIAQAEPGSAHAHYGALARDGISCVVCHQMSPEGLGEPRTYSGKFISEKKRQHVYGPYDKVATLPMENALGLTPREGKHLSDSKLCASCHTVVVPVLDVNRKYTADEFKKLSESAAAPHVFHEQTTYLEWKNSSFSTESKTPHPLQQSCQNCHMPRDYKGDPLAFRIANIEDNTFPIVDHRAKDSELFMQVRDRYSRHALHGINLFTLELFKQHPAVLGVPPRNYLFPSPQARSGFDIAIDSALKMAQEETATVKILSAQHDRGRLKAVVEVKNLTGHKFPTGVNFRRAFLHVQVRSGQRVLWNSGASDEWGVLGTFDEKTFKPLESEFFKNRAYQQHHETITREDQVQIYEQLTTDSNGDFTTSFLSAKNVVKDNRLLPIGWSGKGPDAELTQPRGIGGDLDYTAGAGSDCVTYDIPLNANVSEPLSISATLYYQALPPYYLQQRFIYKDLPATQRLAWLINNLSLKNSSVEGWKVKIGRDAVDVKDAPQRSR
ncbi:MAG TPA: cytochrome P460 family protein [Planctomycetota bacterium]|nr:cytochrome P460 family protein [Planctomycetota bacterium]